MCSMTCLGDEGFSIFAITANVEPISKNVDKVVEERFHPCPGVDAGSPLMVGRGQRRGGTCGFRLLAVDEVGLVKQE